jgi:hypothetical protein
MLTLHIIRENGGWSIRFKAEDPASVLIEQKAEALRVAQRMAARHNEVTILLYDRNGHPPRRIEKRRRSRLLKNYKRS